jgi:hypothetical protein
VGAEAALAGGVDVLPQLRQEARGAVGGEGHHLVLVAAAQEPEVFGEVLVDQAEGVGQRLRGEGVELAVAVAAGQVGGGLAAAVQDEDGAVGVRGGGPGGGGVRDVVGDEDDPLGVEAGQGLGEELGGAARVLQAQRVPGVVQAHVAGGPGELRVEGVGDGVQVAGP